jgi:U3 small nucleolar RNA-associated protein 20
LNTYATFFYVPLAIQLHNDESPKCKKLSWLAIKSLLDKISIEQKDALFELNLQWLKDNDRPLHKRIATLLIKLFIEVEGQQFSRRLSAVLPLIVNELVSQMKDNAETNTSSLLNEKFYDQYLFNLLTLSLKMFSECKFVFVDTVKYSSILNTFYDQIQSYLIHDHSWIRLASSQLFGLLFGSQTIDYLINDKSSYFNYSTPNYFVKIRDLVDNLCIQFKSPILDNETAEQVIKNLAFIARIIKTYSYKHDEQEKEDVEDEDEDEEKIISNGKINEDVLNHDINIQWLIKKVLKEAKYELVYKPKETIKV